MARYLLPGVSTGNLFWVGDLGNHCMATRYETFIASKSQLDSMSGFDPLWVPDFLFDFQRSLVEWSIKKGRAALFADCGLGKTPMQLVWAQNIIEKTNKPVLIVTPLAVSRQTIEEGEKFGIDCEQSRDGKFSTQKKIIVTNYERLHYFDQSDFAGVVCDESSAIKNFNGKRKAIVTEFMRLIPYRLLCTATASPNDFQEMGTSSEALGYLGYTDMITKFFKKEDSTNHHAWGRLKYRFRGHAEHPFWRWVCSWARAIRKPSDLGFSDDLFVLPELIEKETLLENTKPRSGQLFTTPARDLQEQREDRRNTLEERCEVVANAINGSRPAVAWCHLNDEADRLEQMIPDALQVKGSMSDEAKEERLLAFSRGELRVLVTKPKIGCWGLNWQHCSDVFMFPSHSFEQYYQAVRRCWRFGQTRKVTVDVIVTEGEVNVLRNLKRKSDQADRMFTEVTKAVSNELHLNSSDNFTEVARTPEWLTN